MNESHFRGVKFLRRQSQPYPNVQDCLGNPVGRFHDRDWWHAKGTARDNFKAVEADILRQLQTAFKDTYCSLIHFHVYMIGRSDASAKPTIMFFCEEKEPRKKAKKTIDEGGLMERLPGFRTGHQAKQPNVGSLVQPATKADSEINSTDQIVTILHTNVYYDPSCSIRALGMPIFVRHSNGKWRQANAYTVFRQDRCFLMSVVHVFIERTSNKSDTVVDDDSDFDFGSDTGSGRGDEEQVEGTSRASSSNPGSSPDNASEPLKPARGKPPSMATHAEPAQELDARSIGHQSDSLELLGTLLQSSVNQDWALIEITNDSVASTLHEDRLLNRSIPKDSEVAECAKNTRAVVWNAGNVTGTHGILSENTTYMRLPGSITFQNVYHIALDVPITWGDCGAVLLDAETHALYGHVVASSNDMKIAFVMPANCIFGSAKTEWKTPLSTQLGWTLLEEDFGDGLFRTGLGSLTLGGLESIRVEESSRGAPTALTSEISTPMVSKSVSSRRPNEGAKPPFIFRIDEFTENPNNPEVLDGNGKWKPSSIPGRNVRRAGGASGKWWFCFENNIRLLNGWNPPAGSLPYKTFSTVYSDGHGFHVLNGDATNPPASDSWHDLSFDWDERTLSSALTNAGTQRALRVQNPNARWPHMLLPNIYHGPSYAFAGYGGLTGDLPIFLALIAFSMRPERLTVELPKLMKDGEWETHQRSHGRTHKRGVTVYVYAYENNDEELKALENGSLGYYYN